MRPILINDFGYVRHGAWWLSYTDAPWLTLNYRTYTELSYSHETEGFRLCLTTF